MLDRTNMDKFDALKKKKSRSQGKKRVNLNVPTRKEILKNYGFFEQPAIFHVFKHALDEVGHFRQGN